MNWRAGLERHGKGLTWLDATDLFCVYLVYLVWTLDHERGVSEYTLHNTTMSKRRKDLFTLRSRHSINRLALVLLWYTLRALRISSDSCPSRCRDICEAAVFFSVMRLQRRARVMMSL